jgi:hypothetical protein
MHHGALFTIIGIMGSVSGIFLRIMESGNNGKRVELPFFFIKGLETDARYIKES